VTYLLDTNTISDLMRADRQVEAWLDGRAKDDQVVICTISRGEILFGIFRLPSGRRRAQLESAGKSILAQFACVAIPELAADHYAALKAETFKRGVALGENDLWLAATALTLGATLVSRDGDFSDVPGMPVIAPR
jgi:predicted nucleic acid-binding protein